MIRFKDLLLLGFFILSLLPTRALAVIPSGTGFHLLVTPGQPMFGVNFDGVARLQFDGETECTAALITDRHLLSAAHCFFDENGNELADETTLSVDLEHSNGRVNVTFSGEDVAIPENWLDHSADISVITLDAPVAEVFPRYPLYDGRDEIGKKIVVVGYGQSGSGELGSVFFLDEKLAGLNRHEAFGASITGDRFAPIDGDEMLVYDFDSGLSDHNTLEAIGLESGLGFGLDEVKSADGDSGGPIFINGAIAGITSFSEWGFETDFDPDINDTWGELSFSTRVSSFQDFILQATDNLAVFVVPGDFNIDGTLTAEDIDLLSAATRESNPDTRFDLNSDSEVNQLDREFWVGDVADTLFGDANLDSEVTFGDFLSLADNFSDLGGWAKGDFDGSGDVQFADFQLLAANFGRTTTAAASVPEPAGRVTILIVTLLLLRTRHFDNF